MFAWKKEKKQDGVKKWKKNRSPSWKKKRKKQYKQMYGRTVGAIGGACGVVDIRWGRGGGRVLNNNQYPGCYLAQSYVIVI
jgi:hypothetical protein